MVDNLWGISQAMQDRAEENMKQDLSHTNPSRAFCA